MPVSSQLLRPVGPGYILLTLLIAFLVDLMPWQLGSVLLLPDATLLLLLYWAINQPRRIGVGAAFWLGLLMDVADGNVFGQHALSYVLTTYIASTRQRRLAILPLWQQALYILPLLLLSQLLTVAIRWLTGSAFVGWGYFLASLVGTALWLPMTHLLLIPQRKDKPAEL